MPAKAANKRSAKRTTPKRSAIKKTASKGAVARSPKKGPAKPAKGAKKGAPKSKRKGEDKPKLRAVGERGDLGQVPEPPPSSKRNFGLRGAAPWVARHAAKHAEELRKRNAQPPPPGSARATLRIPKEADAIKNTIAQLHQLTAKIRNLRKKFDKSFYEMGLLLGEVQSEELHVAKGYSSFESFLDREVDLPRTMSMRLIRVCSTFTRDTAYDFGIERLTTALAALDGELLTPPPSAASSRGWSSTTMPVKPPIRFEE